MKKLLGVGLIPALALTLSMTVFATAPTITTSGGQANTSVKYQVSPTFTVTIPDSVVLEADKDVTASVKAENVVVSSGQQVNVKITGPFEVKNPTSSDTLTYTIKKSQNVAVNSQDTILSVQPGNPASGSVDLTFSAPAQAKYADTYTGTLTFTVSVDSIP